MFGRRSRMRRRPTRSTSIRVPSRGRPTRARRRPVTPARGRSIGAPPPPPSSRGQQAKRTPTRRTPTRSTSTRRTPVRGQPARRTAPRVGPRQEMPTRSRRTSTSRTRREMPTRSRGSSARARSYLRSMFRNRRR